MKKKTKAAAPRLAKRGKSGVAEPKAAPRRAGRGKAKSVKAKSAKAKSASAPLLAGAPDDAKPAIRRLRTQLAQALKLVGELQASADTDFLLNIPNRRGFERELNRAIA